MTEKLRDSRFQDLPMHCGQDVHPGIDETEEWRDWSHIDTTPDQLRIEKYLRRFGVEDKRILHIGIGNSSLAQRFKNSAAEIVGTSISPNELKYAESLGIENYTAILHNKYRGDDLPGQTTFDFIVDNKPSSFCCCFHHLMTMMEFYARNLTEAGQFVTDRVGLGWVVSTPGANPR